jgi:hypothetical protein
VQKNHSRAIGRPCLGITDVQQTRIDLVERAERRRLRRGFDGAQM